MADVPAHDYRAGLYLRISQDRHGDEAGVRRQDRECRQLADRIGWAIVKVYTDDDTSAYTATRRPGYEQMLADLKAGEIDGILSWHPDRIHRSPRELEDFIDLVESCAAPIRTVRSGDLDLTTPTGRLQARITGAVARHESEHKSDRISSKMVELAHAGKFTGGHRWFGYRIRKMVDANGEAVRSVIEPDEVEASAVCDAAQRVLAGEAWESLAREWNERGLYTPRGNRWTAALVSRLLANPRLAGLAVYKGEVVGEAEWEAILDRATHERLAALRKRNQARNGRKKAARTRLLPGIAVCGRDGCGVAMSATGRGSGYERTQVYECRRRAGRAGCNRNSILGEPTDEHARDLALYALAGPGLQQAIDAASGANERYHKLTEELRAAEERLEQLARDYYTDGVIDRSEYLTAREGLTDRVARLRAQIANGEHVGVLSSLTSGADYDSLRDEWDRRPLEWRRALLLAVFERVVIFPAAHKGQRWTADRIEPVWRV